MTGRNEYRLRAGDYRVIYDFDRAENMIDLIAWGIGAKSAGNKASVPQDPVLAYARPLKTLLIPFRPTVIVVVYETPVRAPAERCFDLARSVRLHADSSTNIAARAVGGRCDGLSNEGDETVWSARFLGLRFRMTTQIDRFNYPTQFGDRLTRGLLRRFEHLYRFETLAGGRCAMSDELTVEAPFGPTGQILERLYLTRRLRHLVGRRLEHIKSVAESGRWREYLPSA